MRTLLLLVVGITTVSAQVAGKQSVQSETWPIGQGVPMVSQQPNDELWAILSQISPNNIKANIDKLVSFGTRHTLSDQTSKTRGIGAARDWIASQMREYAKAYNGAMTVTIPSYVQTPASRIPFNVTISNVVATIKGSDEPNRVYVVSGHYDSRVTDVMNYTDDAPGANDDASGVAVVLELARVFATAKRAPSATIVLAAVAGEEQGLYGSTFLAEQLKASGVDIQGVFNNDIVGSSTGDDGTKDPYTIRLFAQGITENDPQLAQRLQIGGENDTPTRNLARFVQEVGSNTLTNMTVRVIYRLDRYLRGGDHKPFAERGYSAVRFTEPHENFAHQHQDLRTVNGIEYGDLTKFLDYDFIARVAKVNAAAVWSAAQAPGIPKKVVVKTSALDNNSTLTWSAPSTDAGAVPVQSYEVVWRETNAPFWTNVIYVGKTTSANIAVSKDNAILGVRAVGADGRKSPAVLPFPG